MRVIGVQSRRATALNRAARVRVGNGADDGRDATLGADFG